MNTPVDPSDVSPDFRFECLMTTEHGFLLSNGVMASTEVDVNDVERMALSVKHLFDLSRLRPSLASQKAIVFGAIPFNHQGKAQFMLPAEYHLCSKESVHARLKRVPYNDISVTEHYFQPTQTEYEQAVSGALDRFADKNLDKVVLGKQLHLSLSQAVEPAAILQNLLAHNQRGYPFSLPLREGVLLGVSPELLIRKSGDQLSTNPLAGSVKRHGQAKQEEWQALALLHSEKDRREHQLVVDDIARVLAPLCDDLCVPDVPSILKTDSMLHLSSEIAGVAKDKTLSSLHVAMALHPTPAVCGYPTELARAFIAEQEKADRGYFAGLVGWCDEEGNGEWYIAIRCGLVNNDKVTLFAGAGVVAGSDPQMEWQETDAKLSTMLKALDLPAAMQYSDRQEEKYAG
jgi:isochorismate synthase